MQDDPSVAAVGPMFLYPDGRVQEVGGVALATGDAVQIGKGSRLGARALRHAVRRRLLLGRLSDDATVGLPPGGGFGFEWEPAYYEDTDLCLKLWTSCGKVMVNPHARVTHIESHTTSDRRLQLQNISEINRARFVRKWGPWLATPASHQPSGPGAPTEIADVAPRISTTARPGRPRRTRIRPLLPVSARPRRRRARAVRAGPVLSSRRRDQRRLHHAPCYSSIRIRQISSTFGFTCLGTALPWAMVDRRTATSRRSSATRSFRRPSIRQAHVYQIQFPFWVPDRRSRSTGTCSPASTRSGSTRNSCAVTSTASSATTGSGPSDPFPARPCGPAPDRPPWHERRTILTVGRFFAGGHNKRQDVVIEAFRRSWISASGVELALAGAIHPRPEGRERFHELQDMASGLECSFHPNIGHDDLAALYGSPPS